MLGLRFLRFFNDGCEVASRITFLDFNHLLGGAGGHDLAAGGAAFGAEVEMIQSAVLMTSRLCSIGSGELVLRVAG